MSKREEIHAPIDDTEIEVGQVWSHKKDASKYVVITKVLRNPDTKVWGEMQDGSDYMGTARDFAYFFELAKQKGIKADSNKRRYSLLPNGTVNEVVDVLEFGSQKYSDNNWQHVNNARTRYYDAALRHIDAWWHGQINDDETGKHHLAHAVCCLLFLMWFDMEQTDD